jgi:hypothetical protein
LKKNKVSMVGFEAAAIPQKPNTKTRNTDILNS